MDKIMEREIAYNLTLAMKNLREMYTEDELKKAKNEVWNFLRYMPDDDIGCIINGGVNEFEYWLKKYAR